MDKALLRKVALSINKKNNGVTFTCTEVKGSVWRFHTALSQFLTLLSWISLRTLHCFLVLHTWWKLWRESTVLLSFRNTVQGSAIEMLLFRPHHFPTGFSKMSCYIYMLTLKVRVRGPPSVRDFGKPTSARNFGLVMTSLPSDRPPDRTYVRFFI